MENITFNLSTLLNFIKYPSLTEKSLNLYGNRQYTFIVDRSLTKIQLKYIFEKIFNVNITKVNTCNLPIKKKRVGRFVGKKSMYKKVFISLKQGQTIPGLFN